MLVNHRESLENYEYDPTEIRAQEIEKIITVPAEVGCWKGKESSTCCPAGIRVQGTCKFSLVSIGFPSRNRPVCLTFRYFPSRFQSGSSGWNDRPGRCIYLAIILHCNLLSIVHLAKFCFLCFLCFQRQRFSLPLFFKVKTN